MFKRILVPVDGSQTATKALVAALQLARDGGGRVRLVNIVEELSAADSYGGYGGYSEELVLALREGSERVLSDAMAVAQSAGVEADTMLYDKFGERLGEVIADAAMLWNADLVVVGTHGRRGIGRMFLGSGAEQIIRLSPVPVLVFRSPDEAAAKTA
ncbi:MAG: UspA domain protein [Ramlibacter sp.]|nr:UspA domain protein [Ramlibacter sp.]